MSFGAVDDVWHQKKFELLYLLNLGFAAAVCFSLMDLFVELQSGGMRRGRAPAPL